jgi:hypothetical protein
MTEEIRVDGVANLAASLAPLSQEPAKKKRGRPPKKKPEAPAPVAAPVEAKENTVIPPLDDDDDDLVEDQVFTPRIALPPRIPGAPLPSTAQIRQQVMQQQQKVNDDFEAHLASLEFEDGHHSVTVHRVEPEIDPNTGKRIAGYLAKFTRAVTFEEIRSQYGGGKYRFIIHGPGPLGRPMIKANKVYEIAGDPLPARNAVLQQQQQNALPSAVTEIVDKAISTQERQADRLSEENRELKQMFMASLTKGDSGFRETMMQMMAEERKMQEARAAKEREEAKEMRNLFLSSLTKAEQGPQQLQSVLLEERRMQEQRMMAEREERRREQEAAERRHRETLEIMRMQQEKQIEAMRIEQERVRAEARAAEERARQQFELQLRQIEKQESQKEAQALKMTEFMSALQSQQVQQMQMAQQTQLQQMQQFTQLERDFMLKQIDALSKKDTGIDQMLKFKQVFDTLTGRDVEGDSKETWEKVMDRIQDSVPGIVAAAGLLRGGVAQPSQPQGPRVLPGSVAIVEDDEEEDVRALPSRRPPPRRRRRPPITSQAIAPTTVETAPPPAPSPASSGTLPNDYTDFVFPTDDTPIEAALEMLVRDIDLALQRDLDVEGVRTEVVDKFPKHIVGLLSNTDADTLISVLEARAPGTWRINSLDGQKKVRELHALLAS